MLENYAQNRKNDPEALNGGQNIAQNSSAWCLAGMDRFISLILTIYLQQYLHH